MNTNTKVKHTYCMIRAEKTGYYAGYATHIEPKGGYFTVELKQYRYFTHLEEFTVAIADTGIPIDKGEEGKDEFWRLNDIKECIILDDVAEIAVCTEEAKRAIITFINRR